MGMRHFNCTFTFPKFDTPSRRRLLGRLVCVSVLTATMLRGAVVAQPQGAQPVSATAASAPVEKNPGVTQQQLMKLLGVSPTLAETLSSDPALLSDQAYVARNNPELAQFLTEHPEIARNPSFYLFSDLREPGQSHYDVLEPRRGFEHHEPRSEMREFGDTIGPFFAMIVCLGAVLWLIRLMVGNRRWGRAFKVHSDVHGKLIDKFGTSQELLAYIETDAGKRFLEAAPIATEVDSQRLPNLVARVITTLQIGVVLTLTGIGLIFLRHSVGDGEMAMLVLGTLLLMPGVGFLISAGITWVLARRLGLIDQPAGAPDLLRERQ
jgi:hypothetical protein